MNSKHNIEAVKSWLAEAEKRAENASQQGDFEAFKIAEIDIANYRGMLSKMAE